jgi:hypothetical protein
MSCFSNCALPLSCITSHIRVRLVCTHVVKYDLRNSVVITDSISHCQFDNPLLFFLFFLKWFFIYISPMISWPCMVSDCLVLFSVKLLSVKNNNRLSDGLDI